MKPLNNPSTLVVGSGGREHALAWKLSQETETLCTPGNPGIAADVEVANVATKDFPALIDLCKNRSIDLVVVGPEDPLVDGLADALRAAGIAVYGPEQRAANLEGSKAFSKDMMRAASIPTAEYQSFTDAATALEYTKEFYSQGRQVAVKASGNALGKGVVVAETLDQATEAIERMMVHKEFGEAGTTVVIEERLIGREFSLLTIVGDHNFVSLPVAQDHKRAFDGDQGPNTGGMGTFAPCPWISEDLIKEAERVMVAPLIKTLHEQGISYRGTLFSGVMVVDNKPYCLEYNVRFGDPETQSVMLRLGSGFATALHEAATGKPITPPEVLQNAAVTIVVASGGYPGPIQKGLPISLKEIPSGAKLFHAGTAEKNSQLVTNGGRVLGASASAPTLEEAKSIAYQAAEAVQFEGAFFRKDIGSI